MIKKYDPNAFHHHSNPLIRFIERKRVKIIFRFMDIQEADLVLEVGCGAGNVIEKASRGTLFGVDLSSSILMKAQQRLGGTIHLFQGDAQNLPCKDRVFNQIICSEVLEHLLEPSSALKDMLRILRPKGVAIISIPNEFWINRIKRLLIRLRVFHFLVDRRGGYRQMSQKMDDEWHLHSFRLDEWVNMATKYFRVTRLKKIPFVLLPLRYVIRLEKS